MSLQAGEQLGPYKIIATIGAGGMGEVYRARDPRLEREVAIKILPERVAADAEALARFEREAKAVAALAHPNILAIHDVGTDRGITYLVMELLEGQTLRERLRRTRPAWRKAVEQAIAIADGLMAAHAKSIVHRDLKPDNIFITTGGVVKIVDFGLAEVAKRVATRPVPTPDGTTLTRDATPTPVTGTLGYMSPEQVRGEAVDARSDIFAFGCVLYEVLTGRRTFTGETAADTMSATLREYPPGPTATGADIPPELERIVMRCLEKDPQDRFFSAHDLAIALRDVLADSGQYKPPKASVRRRWVTPTIAAASLAVLALLVVLNPGGLRDRLWPGVQPIPGVRDGRDTGATAMPAVPGATTDALLKSSDTPAATPGKIASLAVLPLENLSGDPEQEYFADGMTEALIADLGQISALRVISRTSAMHYKGTHTPIPQVGRELNVDAVLEGTVQRGLDKVAIRVRLIHAPTDRQLWSERYERDLRDVLVLQNDVARAVADEIKIKLTPQDQEQLAKSRPVDPEAHELYLRGRYYWNKRTQDGIKKSHSYFQQAIDKDPTYALAYAGLADAYLIASDHGVMAPREAQPRAEAAARKALELDETLAEAYTALAAVLCWFQRDLVAAEAAFRRAIELNPGYATAHDWYGDLLSVLGHVTEGWKETQRARELDPLSRSINVCVGYHLYHQRRYEEAIAQWRTTLDLDPSFPRVHSWLGLMYARTGRFEEATAAALRAVELSQGAPAEVAALAYIYSLAGRTEQTRKLLCQLVDRSAREYVMPYCVAIVHAGLGERDSAFQYLEKAVQEHDTLILYLGVDPIWDPLRSDPRFDDLLRRIGLPPSAAEIVPAGRPAGTP